MVGCSRLFVIKNQAAATSRKKDKDLVRRFYWKDQLNRRKNRWLCEQETILLYLLKHTYNTAIQR